MIEKVRPATVIIELAIAERIARGAFGSEGVEKAELPDRLGVELGVDFV